MASHHTVVKVVLKQSLKKQTIFQNIQDIPRRLFPAMSHFQLIPEGHKSLLHHAPPTMNNLCQLTLVTTHHLNIQEEGKPLSHESHYILIFYQHTVDLQRYKQVPGTLRMSYLIIKEQFLQESHRQHQPERIHKSPQIQNFQ